MQKFKSARESLKFLIREFKIKEIYIPYYLCDVIRHSVVEEKCKPLFYHINDDFMPAQSFPQNSFILYPNYFGICDYNVDKLISIYPNLIVDNAHAFYSAPKGLASFNSIKKFFPQENGSYLWIKGDPIIEREIDFERRRKFYEYHHTYGKKNLLEINLEDKSVPFCYPFLASSIEEADFLVKDLTSKGLTIYRYWNSLPKSYNEYKFYSRLVPIPLIQ